MGYSCCATIYIGVQIPQNYNHLAFSLASHYNLTVVDITENYTYDNDSDDNDSDNDNDDNQTLIISIFETSLDMWGYNVSGKRTSSSSMSSILDKMHTNKQTIQDFFTKLGLNTFEYELFTTIHAG